MKKTFGNLSFDELKNQMEVLENTSKKRVLGGKEMPQEQIPDMPDPFMGGTGGGYNSNGKNSGFDSGYSLGGFTGAGRTPSMDNSSVSNPSGNNSGNYIADPNTYISASGDPYNKVSFDGGKTWVNQAGPFVFDLEAINQNLGNYADLAALGAYASNNVNAANAFGKISYATQAIGVGLDSKKLYEYYNNNQGDMDGMRFSIRTGGTGASIIASSVYGGPEGIIVGTIVTGIAITAEYDYDGVTKALNEVWGEFMNQYSNGWLPSTQ